MNSSFFLRVLLIPSTVFLAVVFGGSYGSGREIAQFITGHGPVGGFVSITTIFVVYSACLFICFELARMHKAYEYRGFTKVILGRAWFLYEILIMLGLIITLAVCASAAGSIFEDHFTIPQWAGGLGLLLIVVTFNYRGRAFIERSMIYSVSALGLLLVYLLYEGFTGHSATITGAFSEYTSDNGQAITGGMKYAFTNAGFIPLLLYCSRDLRTRKEVLIASVFAAFVAEVPGIAFHISFMLGYPEILDQRLPTYWLIEQMTSLVFLNIYVTVLFVMVAQTGVGVLQGLVERIDAWMLERSDRPLAPLGHAIVSGGAVVLSMSLATMGIVALIIRGYTFLSISFALVLFAPLFTVGIYKIVSSPGSQEQ